MSHLNITSLVVIGATLLLQSCYYDKEETLYPKSSSGCEDTPVTYTASIVPILNQYCISCHSAAANQTLGGGYNLEGYDNVKQYAAPNGLLIKSVMFDPSVSPMPDGGPQLPACDLEKISKWVNAGAPNN